MEKKNVSQNYGFKWNYRSPAITVTMKYKIAVRLRTSICAFYLENGHQNTTPLPNWIPFLILKPG